MAGGAGKQFVWNTQQKLAKMRMTAALVLQYASLGGGARERVLPYLRRLVGAGETEQYEKIIERATALFDAMAEPKTGKPAHAAPTPAEWARLAALWHSAPRGGEARDAWIAQARSILDDMSRARGGAARLPFHARALLPNEVLQPGAEGARRPRTCGRTPWRGCAPGGRASMPSPSAACSTTGTAPSATCGRRPCGPARWPPATRGRPARACARGCGARGRAPPAAARHAAQHPAPPAAAGPRLPLPHPGADRAGEGGAAQVGTLDADALAYPGAAGHRRPPPQRRRARAERGGGHRGGAAAAPGAGVAALRCGGGTCSHSAQWRTIEPEKYAGENRRR